MLTIFCCLWPIKLMGRNAWLSESQWQILYLFLCVLWSRLHALTVNMQVNLTLIRCVTGPVWCDVTITSPVGMVAKYCDECVCVCLSVCVWVCLSVCLWAYLRNHTCDLYQFFCACCLWPWLGPPLARWRNPKGKGQFWGFSSPLTMHCNAFAANGIGREGGDGSVQHGQSVIYDCLVAIFSFVVCTIYRYWK